MALNYIWFFFFLIAFVIAAGKWIFTGDPLIFKEITEGIFKSAGDSVDLSFKLIGIMTLFLGFMNIGERAGAIRFLSRIVAPFFSRLFPELPEKHPAYGHMMMNFSANLLGLDNAATPFGLKAMESLQTLNPNKDTASNAQIMFMVLHASGLTLIPISIIAIRASVNPPSANPTDIFHSMHDCHLCCNDSCFDHCISATKNQSVTACYIGMDNGHIGTHWCAHQLFKILFDQGRNGIILWYFEQRTDSFDFPCFFIGGDLQENKCF